MPEQPWILPIPCVSCREAIITTAKKLHWSCKAELSLLRDILYVFIAAVAAALVNPRKDALLQLNITPQERARLNALIMASTVALSSPFGYLAGWLSSMDRRLPFVFTLLLFVTAMFAIGRIQEPQVEER